MPTDTPTDRAALEALAADAEGWLRYWGWPNEPLAATTSPEGDLLASIAKYAPALRALAARAEPPADVARLVEEAEMLAKEADNRDACEAVPGGFDARVAATLRALAAKLKGEG